MRNLEAELSKDDFVRIIGCDIDGILRMKLLEKEKFLKGCITPNNPSPSPLGT